MIQTFFRIVGSYPPTESDFYSYEQLGISVARTNARTLRLQQGVSFYATLERAVRQAQQYPHLGSYIAIMEIDNERVTVEQSGRDPAHYTIWAEPLALLDTVTATVNT